MHHSSFTFPEIEANMGVHIYVLPSQTAPLQKGHVRAVPIRVLVILICIITKHIF